MYICGSNCGNITNGLSCCHGDCDDVVFNWLTCGSAPHKAEVLFVPPRLSSLHRVTCFCMTTWQLTFWIVKCYIRNILMIRTNNRSQVLVSCQLLFSLSPTVASVSLFGCTTITMTNNPRAVSVWVCVPFVLLSNMMHSQIGIVFVFNIKCFCKMFFIDSLRTFVSFPHFKEINRSTLLPPEWENYYYFTGTIRLFFFVWQLHVLHL